MEIVIKIDCGDVKLENKKGSMDDGRMSLSPYARFFNSSCPGWSKDPEMNKLFLKQIENYMNEKLKAQSYLFLNEVYDQLGMARSKVGQIVGWIYNPENPTGDNHVDFDIYSDRNQDFVNGIETDALLDFNVDGYILNIL